MQSVLVIYPCCYNCNFPEHQTLPYSTTPLESNQLTQVAQNEQGESVQRKRRSAMASLYVYLVFTVCYLPNVCVLIIIASTSEPRNDLQHLHFYTLTLLFLNSTLNPLIYCWKVKQIRHTDSHTAKYIVKSHLTKLDYE